MMQMMEAKMQKIIAVTMNNDEHMNARELTCLLHLGWLLNCLLVSSLLSTNVGRYNYRRRTYFQAADHL